MHAAKRRAAERGTTLTQVMEEALRALLAARDDSTPAPFKLVTFGEGGLRPGVDLDDSAGLLDLVEPNAPS